MRPTLVGPCRAAALRRRAGLPLAVALATACTDGTATPPPAPSAETAMLLGGEPRAHPIGELAVAPDYTMSMESDKECPVDSFATKRGFVKLGIELSVAGTSAIEVPVNPFYATLSD